MVELVPIVASGKRSGTGYKEAHARKFGLEVATREAETGVVVSVVCLFCKHLGREEKAGSKRAATANLKYYRHSFRTDQYRQHLVSQHPRAWARYCSASDLEYGSFFTHQANNVRSTHHHDSNHEIDTSTTRDDVDNVDDKGDVEATIKVDDSTSSGLSPPPVAAARKKPRLSMQVVKRSAKTEAAQPDRRPTPPPTAPSAATALAACVFNVRKELVDLVVGTEHVWRPLGCVSSELHRRPDDSVGTQAMYRVTVRRQLQLELAVDLTALGLTPRQVAKTLTAMTARAGLDPVLAAAEHDAVELVRLSTAVSLDVLAQLLERSWAFSLSMRTAERSADLDVRVRVYSTKTMQSLHLVALPPADTDAMFTAFDRVMTAVLPSWRTRLIGLGCDSDTTATGLVRQFISRVQQDVPHAVYRTWSGSAQLAAALQSQFYDVLLDGAFVPAFKSLTAYVRSQERLVADMGCPPSGAAADATPWLRMGTDAKWVTDKRVRLRKHLEDAKPLAAPSDAWWVSFFVVHWVTERAHETFQKLQNKHVIATHQAAVLSEFVEELVQEFRVQGPLLPPVSSSNASGDFEQTGFSRQRTYAIATATVHDFLGDLGAFVNSIVARTEAAELEAVVANVAASLANLVEALAAATDKLMQAGTSDATAVLPPAYPREFAQLSGREFASLLERHSTQLRQFFSDEDLDVIDQEHQVLRRASVKEKLSTSLLSGGGGSDDVSFEQAWSASDGRFPALQNFAGGLATVFSAAVSGGIGAFDLADLPRSTSGSSSSREPLDLVDFAVEGALHAQQFHQLQRLL